MSVEAHFQNQTIDSFSPFSEREMERVLALNELGLDYSEMDQAFAGLTKLAAKIAGTSSSMINFIDVFTQWSVASYGMHLRQSPREKSICEYTIMEENAGGMEVNDLSMDERFKDRFYVAESPYLKYYFGIPLKVDDRPPIGALCVIHEDDRSLDAEKKEMLAMIAGEIVSKIKMRQALAMLRRQAQESNDIKNKVAHDIRGPIAGIIGLAEIIQMQAEDKIPEEVLSYIGLIQKSANSLLELADEILLASQDSDRENRKLKDCEFTLSILEAKLLNLFGPQAITKHVNLTVEIISDRCEIPFPKTNILQILGNLISNSIKFTPEGGTVTVVFDLQIQDRSKVLKVKVKDSGIGMSQEKIEGILTGKAISSAGTCGEKGFGFGLNLVHHLVRNLNGQMLIQSAPGQGSEFDISLPFS